MHVMAPPAQDRGGPALRADYQKKKKKSIPLQARVTKVLKLHTVQCSSNLIPQSSQHT